MGGKGSGNYKHHLYSNEEIERCRKAYYKWSKRPDPFEKIPCPYSVAGKEKGKTESFLEENL